MLLTEEQKQVLQTNLNLMVLAGAGTGKTSTLTQRIMYILSERQAKPGECLVLTFTNKAASEIRERIYNELLLASLKKPDNQTLANAVSQFDEMEINTFHGFFAGILRRNGYLEHIPHDFNILEDGSASATLPQQLTYSLVDKWSKKHPRELSRIFSYLDMDGLEQLSMSILHNRPALEDALDKLRDHGIWKKGQLSARGFLQLFRMDFSPLFNEMENQLRPMFLNLSQLILTLGKTSKTIIGWQRSCKQAEKILSRNPKGKADNWKEFFRLFADNRLLKKDGKLTTQYLRNNEIKTAIEAFNSVLLKIESKLHLEKTGLLPLLEFDEQTLIDTGYFDGFASLLNWVEDFLEDYAKYKKYRNFLDFNDLERLTLKLLNAHSELAEDYRRSIRYIMLDEFQDTNFTQWEIMAKFFMTDGQLEKEKLCLVGDKKQAIYRFRGGEVEVCDFAESLILSSNPPDKPGIIPFTINFRSKPHLLRFFNTFASIIFPPESHANHYDPSYIALNPITENSEEYVPPLTLGLLNTGATESGDKIDSATATRLEAQTIAKFLSYVMKEDWDSLALLIGLESAAKAKEYWLWLAQSMKARKKSVGILLRRKQQMPLFERMLAEAKLPFKMESDTGFFTQPEIIEILNVLRMIHDPENNANVVACLRSTIWGASDLFITFLAAAGFTSQSYVQRLRQLYELVRDIDLRSLATSNDFILLKELPQEVAELIQTNEKSRKKQWDLSRLEFPKSDWIFLQKFFPIFESLQKAFLSESLEAAFHQLISGFRIPQLLQAYDDAPQKLANLRKFIEFMASFSISAESGHLASFLEYCVEMGKRNSEGSGELDDDAVIQVLTVHKSKGLEFPLVILPDLPTSDSRSLKSRKKQLLLTDSLTTDELNQSLFRLDNISLESSAVSRPSFPVVVASSNKTLEKSIFWPFEHYLHQKEIEKEFAEERRLLYVALTRAEKGLMIFNRIDKNKNFPDFSFVDQPCSWSELLYRIFDDIQTDGNTVQASIAAPFQDIPIRWFDVPKEISLPKKDQEKAESKDPVFISIPSEKRTPAILPSDLAPETQFDSGLYPPSFKLKPDEFGTLVHYVLEMEYSQSQINAFLDQHYPLLDSREKTAIFRHAEHANQMLTILKKSTGSIHRELAFVWPSPFENISGEFTGVIDWVQFDHENRQGIIADFKTNMVPHPDKKYAAEHGYDLQLAIYHAAFEFISGMKTEKACLLFTHNGDIVTFTRDELEKRFQSIAVKNG